MDTKVISDQYFNSGFAVPRAKKKNPEECAAGLTNCYRCGDYWDGNCKGMGKALDQNIEIYLDEEPADDIEEE